MNENIWQTIQIAMWLIGLQTVFITAVIGFVWNNLSKRIEKMEDRMTRLETNMVEMKTVLRMIEGNLSTHGFCLYSQCNKPEKKAE